MTAQHIGCQPSELAIDGDEPDDEIIVTVRCGLDETSRWWLQRPQSSWQIAQIAEDLEEHLIGLIEADDPERNDE